MPKTHSFLQRLTNRSLAVAALPLALAAALPQAKAADGWAQTATHAVQVPTSAQVTGLASQQQAVHIAVALKLRNHSQLDSFVEQRRQVAQTAPSLLGPAMSTATFLSQHAPKEDDAQAVIAHLTAAGFTNVQLAPNRLLITADGTVAAAQRAFQTSFVKVHTKDGREAIANDQQANIPSALQDKVLSVIGLQNVHQVHTMLKYAKSQGGLHTDAAVGHNPTEFSSIYGGSDVTTASTVPVGIIAIGSLTQTLKDLKTFASNNSLSTISTKVVGSGSSDTSGLDEWDLDSQDIVGVAGGKVSKLIFYDGTSYENSALTSAINSAVSADAAPVVNVSLGECETYTDEDGSMAADDELFQTAEAQGQTFSVSSGDSGSDECDDGGKTPSYPASSPYVVAVGGTHLVTTSSGAYSSETAWDGSGGSPSTIESRPSWQTAISGSKRGVPDVGFDADPNTGALVVVDGSSEQIGGTSLAAPLFAGSWARLLAGHSSLGFAGPHIYKLPASDYHDVTSGSNGDYSAASGYDYVTGRGSFKLGTVDGNIDSY